MKKFSFWLKVSLGLFLSLIFMVLAFRNADLNQMIDAFKNIDIIYLFLILIANIASEWARVLRWRLLLLPIKATSRNKLFASLMIGYAGNTVLPAHLGEFLRAYMLSKKEKIAASSIFATIVTERIIDMLSVFALMIFTFIFFPFPELVKKSGYILFAVTLLLCVILFFANSHLENIFKFFRKTFKFFPEKIYSKLHKVTVNFSGGFVKLGNTRNYITVIVLSIFIWVFHGLAFQFAFFAFDFDLPWTAPLVLLVITAISVIVPSSPGYIGTYHWTCQFALGLFYISESPALALAFIVHALNIYPFFLIGLLYAWQEGINVFGFSKLSKYRSAANIE